MNATQTPQGAVRGALDDGTFEVSHIKDQHKRCKGDAPALNTPPTSPPQGKRLKFF